MSKKLLLCLVLLTVLPLAAIAWLGVSRLANQQQIVEQHYRDMLQEKCTLYAKTVTAVIVEMETYLRLQLNCSNTTINVLDGLAAHEPLMQQPFILDSSGIVRYPDALRGTSSREAAFLQRTAVLFKNQSFFRAIDQASTLRERMVQQREAIGDYGWIPWYWEEGLHCIFWHRCNPATVVGSEIEIMTLLSRTIAALPEISEEQGLFQLRDAGGTLVHQWGNGDSTMVRTKTFARAELAAPLTAWTIVFVAHEIPLLSSLVQSQIVTSIIVLAALLLVVLLVAVYFYRDTSRQMREARMRVDFVNQVSHELKTPLTNIRLYAEMIRADVDDEDPTLASRLDIILSESLRLTRMITGILTFAQKGRSRLKLYKRAIVIDSVIAGVLDQFILSFKKRGISTVDCLFNATIPVLADSDAIGQIVANLISNVEKYAADGEYLGIRTTQTPHEVCIRVIDHGSGIPPSHRNRIFEPYYRISNKLSEGVSGAGIGLTISRELARLHGGDLRLAESDNGAVFECTIVAEPSKESVA